MGDAGENYFRVVELGQRDVIFTHDALRYYPQFTTVSSNMATDINRQLFL